MVHQRIQQALVKSLSGIFSLAFYNHCRLHKTLRVTPARESGIAHRPLGAWRICSLFGVGINKMLNIYPSNLGERHQRNEKLAKAIGTNTGRNCDSDQTQFGISGGK